MEKYYPECPCHTYWLVKEPGPPKDARSVIQPSRPFVNWHNFHLQYLAARQEKRRRKPLAIDFPVNPVCCFVYPQRLQSTRQLFVADLVCLHLADQHVSRISLPVCPDIRLR